MVSDEVVMVLDEDMLTRPSWWLLARYRRVGRSRAPLRERIRVASNRGRSGERARDARRRDATTQLRYDETTIAISSLP